MNERPKLRVIPGGKRNYGVPPREPVAPRSRDAAAGPIVLALTFTAAVITILIVLIMSAHS